jgi:ubiquinone/menaquinone biosynthesis C-methylase UbiE
MNNLISLKKQLAERAPIKTTHWVENLEERKKEEATFHDLVRDDSMEESHRSNLKFYKIVKKSKTYVRQWLKNHVNGKVFLDYACGEGRHAEYVLANATPSLLVGIDISPFSVRLAAQKAKDLGFQDKCFFLQGDCENTELPDNSMDVILCSEMLHHLDLKKALNELYRILAPGGMIMCVEALGINPMIQWYRNRTSELRTEFEKEHILKLDSLKLAKEIGFEVVEVKFWHLFSIPSAFFHRIKWLFSVLLLIGNAIDSVVMKIPYIQRLAWQFSFVLRKKSS